LLFKSIHAQYSFQFCLEYFEPLFLHFRNLGHAGSSFIRFIHFVLPFVAINQHGPKYNTDATHKHYHELCSVPIIELIVNH